MEIEIDFTKSAQENAEEYFSRSKRAERKAAGADAAAEELEGRLGELDEEREAKRQIRNIKKEWYERFNWFFTSEGMLAVGGRSAVQNEELNSKYFEDNDLFFHADVFGASVVILKDGGNSSSEARDETAQFAASFSRAWENAQTAVDVYAMRRKQVTKSTGKGSLSTGSFLLEGEREWHKNVQLKLAAFMHEGKIMIAPFITSERLKVKERAVITIGRSKKSDAAKAISGILPYHDIDYIMQHLPAGTFQVKKA